jgi:hypothetical protein
MQGFRSTVHRPLSFPGWLQGLMPYAATALVTSAVTVLCGFAILKHWEAQANQDETTSAALLRIDKGSASPMCFVDHGETPHEVGSDGHSFWIIEGDHIAVVSYCDRAYDFYGGHELPLEVKQDAIRRLALFTAQDALQNFQQSKTSAPSLRLAAERAAWTAIRDSAMAIPAEDNPILFEKIRKRNELLRRQHPHNPTEDFSRQIKEVIAKLAKK